MEARTKFRTNGHIGAPRFKKQEATGDDDDFVSWFCDNVTAARDYSCTSDVMLHVVNEDAYHGNAYYAGRDVDIDVSIKRGMSKACRAGVEVTACVELPASCLTDATNARVCETIEKLAHTLFADVPVIIRPAGFSSVHQIEFWACGVADRDEKIPRSVADAVCEVLDGVFRAAPVLDALEHGEVGLDELRQGCALLEAIEQPVDSDKVLFTARLIASNKRYNADGNDDESCGHDDDDAPYSTPDVVGDPAD